MTPAQIKNKYQKRILKGVLGGIKEALEDEGYVVDDPFEMSDEEYRWDMVVQPNKKLREPVDINFTILESEVTEGEKGGVAFSLDIVSEGGRILGGMTPYNYSPQLWVPRKDPEEIEERFRLFEQADPGQVVDLLAPVTR